jgi:uncharacterized protein (DUF3084 family)
MAQLIEIPTMHEDHRNWLSEHSMWRQDLRSWQKQLADGLLQFEKLEEALDRQHQSLADHVKTIEEQEQSLLAHEHELASCERFGMGFLESLTLKHLELGKEIVKTREEHERMKKFQHAVLAKLAELKKTIDSAH